MCIGVQTRRSSEYLIRFDDFDKVHDNINCCDFIIR